MKKYGESNFIQVRQLTQYMFFSKSKHSLLKNILENIVEAIKLEYFGRHPFYFHARDPKWKYVICATGPDMWGASYLESVLENRTTDDKVTMVNFIKEYSVTFKVQEAKHYLKRTEKNQHYYHMNGMTFLNSYYPDVCIDRLEGKVIRLQNTMYLISNNTLMLVPNYDTFCAMNFTLHDVVIYQKIPKSLENITIGPQLPPLDWKLNMC
jgi:hypothetical protein